MWLELPVGMCRRRGPHDGPTTISWLETGHPPHGIPVRERVKNQLERRGPPTRTLHKMTTKNTTTRPFGNGTGAHPRRHALTHLLLVWPFLIGTRDVVGPADRSVGTWASIPSELECLGESYAYGPKGSYAWGLRVGAGLYLGSRWKHFIFQCPRTLGT